MTAYIKLSTNEYPRYAGDIAIDPAGATDYAPLTWVEPPDFDPVTQCCYATDPLLKNGEWKMAWAVRDFTSEEIEQALNLTNQMKLRK